MQFLDLRQFEWALIYSRTGHSSRAHIDTTQFHTFFISTTRSSPSPPFLLRVDFREVVYGFSEESSRSLKYRYNKTKKYSSVNQKINLKRYKKVRLKLINY